MRPISITLLAAAALVLGAANANAYRVFLSANTQAPALNSTIAIDVHLDTQGQSNITILGVAVTFDTTALTYQPTHSYSGPSPAQTYILYSPGAGATQATWLEPRIPAPSTISYNPPLLLLASTDQGAPLVAIIGFVEPNFKATVPTTADTVIAHLVFQATVAGASSIGLAVGPHGTIFQLGDGTRPTVDTGTPLNIIVPEPAIISLSIATLLTLCALRMRRRAS